ncbi:MAG TPA: polyprenyl synthetase family protein [Firmicutes bacterium]|nr:polyprenyl synthetase family protein [Bacillota bacterium]
MHLSEKLSQTGTWLKIKQVQKLLHDILHSSSGCLQAIMDYLLISPGKQMRPLLVLLSAGLMQPGSYQQKKINESLIKVAAAVELIHTASLVHDDLIDESDLRRGQMTIHQLWGKPEAVLAGDYLIARAFQLLSETGSAGALIPVLARSVSLLCRGEAGQLEEGYNWKISEQDYFRFNYLKTSQFIASCCEAGGRVTGAASSSDIRALRRFGCKIGQAFQVIDDILDFTESRQKIGKPVGLDVKQGFATLPLIYLLRKNKRYSALCNQLNGLPLSASLWEQLQLEVRNGGALEYTYRQALNLKQEALAALFRFPPSPYLSLLNELAEAVISRVSQMVEV